MAGTKLVIFYFLLQLPTACKQACTFDIIWFHYLYFGVYCYQLHLYKQHEIEGGYKRQF